GSPSASESLARTRGAATAGGVSSAVDPTSSSAATGAVSRRTVSVTVAAFDVRVPSLAWYVKLSGPVYPASGVYEYEPSAFSVSEPCPGSLAFTAVIGSPSGSLSFARTPGAATVRAWSCATSCASSTATGGSGLPATVTDAVSESTLNAVVPPRAETSTRDPAVPLVRSHATNVIDAVPLKFGAGTNRTEFVPLAARRSAEPAETAPIALQLEPLFVRYPHVPCVSSTAVSAMPCSAPASTSWMYPGGAPPSIVETWSPPGWAATSATEVSGGSNAAGSSTGASFTAVTVIVNVWPGLASTPPEAVPPSSWRTAVTVADPFAFGAGS